MTVNMSADEDLPENGSESVAKLLDWNNLSFTAQQAYILRRLGPPHQDLSVAVPYTVFYTICFLVGVPGNVLTCVIILRKQSMRTASNFFLLNLAVTDLIALTVGKSCRQQKGCSTFFY